MILEDSETGKGRHLGRYSMHRQALVKRCMMAGLQPRERE